MYKEESSEVPPTILYINSDLICRHAGCPNSPPYGCYLLEKILFQQRVKKIGTSGDTMSSDISLLDTSDEEGSNLVKDSTIDLKLLRYVKLKYHSHVMKRMWEFLPHSNKWTMFSQEKYGLWLMNEQIRHTLAKHVSHSSNITQQLTNSKLTIQTFILKLYLGLITFVVEHN